MNPIIKTMAEEDSSAVIEMMRVFYASDAVSTNGSETIFRADLTACLSSPFAEGFVLKDGKEYLGYAMIAKSFSTEFGKPCVWIEDLYLKPSARGKGLGGEVIKFIEARYPGAVLRLEAEKENAPALSLYQKSGFTPLPYEELIKL